jgi:hypothetical protein
MALKKINTNNVLSFSAYRRNLMLNAHFSQATNPILLITGLKVRPANKILLVVAVGHRAKWHLKALRVRSLCQQLGKKNSLVRGPIIYKQYTMNLLLVTVSIELAKYYHLDQIFGQLPEKRYTIEILGIF